MADDEAEDAMGAHGVGADGGTGGKTQAPPAESTPVDPAKIRTAVVIVHGMGQQKPVETLRDFVRTALPKHNGAREYYSRPAKLTGSYEARRMLASKRPGYGQTDFYEYHWSYKMTGNKVTDFLPTFIRLMLGFWRVPRGLRVVWVIAWAAIIALAWWIVATIVATAQSPDWSVAGIVGLVLGQGILATIVVKAVGWLGGVVTDTFVDVARYLDNSPRSYGVRRDIRDGMVELLRGLHDDGRYSRIVVAAHSLGGYIAYDGIVSLWNELSSAKGDAGPKPGDPYPHLKGLEELARTLGDGPEKMDDLSDADRARIAEYQTGQFELWREYRAAGNRWLVTDLVTFGTPMYFADLLYTKNRREFRQLVHNSEVPQCPPRSSTEMVESPTKSAKLRYGYTEGGRQYLAAGSLFAVTRWTNIFYPAVWSFFGDWFGGSLRPLFGKGIREIAIKGNKPGRFAPGAAHGKYFSYPDADGADDIATIVHEVLRLNIDARLAPPKTA